MSVNELPIEMVYEIARNMIFHELGALSQTSREFQDIIDPYLFSFVCIRDENVGRNFINALIARPYIVPLVKTLYVNGNLHFKKDVTYPEDYVPGIDRLLDLESLFMHFPASTGIPWERSKLFTQAPGGTTLQALKRCTWPPDSSASWTGSN